MEYLRRRIKRLMNALAAGVDKASGGRVNAAHITWLALILHLPLALMIAGGSFLPAGVLLLPIGLLDSLDGALARRQGSAGPAGMVLDASADRVKESLLFSALVYAFAADGNAAAALFSAAAATGSITVSYVKAKGEAALQDGKIPAAKINDIFKSGLARYEVRTAILAAGLIFNAWLEWAVLAVAALSWLTAAYRLASVTGKLKKGR